MFRNWKFNKMLKEILVKENRIRIPTDDFHKDIKFVEVVLIFQSDEEKAKQYRLPMVKESFWKDYNEIKNAW